MTLRVLLEELRLNDRIVDKVVISQEDLGRFINYFSPGAYASMTKVDFAALDQLSIQPVGIYGSKSEIVRFLKDMEVINDAMYV